MATNPPWAETLRQTLQNIRRPERAPRVAIVGIGHPLRGDDAAGSLIAQRLRAALREEAPGLLVLDGGPAPENVTGALRRFAPDLVLLIDSAQMDEPPGTVRWLDWRGACGMSGSSHTLPPTLLARYLVAELGCAVALIGIQPAQDEFGAALSVQVEGAAQSIQTAIQQWLAAAASPGART
jgi:hydrogenase 3 maturation protease